MASPRVVEEVARRRAEGAWSELDQARLFARVAHWCLGDAATAIIRTVEDCAYTRVPHDGRGCAHNAFLSDVIRNNLQPIGDKRRALLRAVVHAGLSLIADGVVVFRLKAAVVEACLLRIGASLVPNAAFEAAEHAARAVLIAHLRGDEALLRAAETRLGACCLGATWDETEGLCPTPPP